MKVSGDIKGRVLNSGFIFPFILLIVFCYLTLQAPSFHARARVFPLTVGGLGVLLTLLELIRQVLSWRRKPGQKQVAETPKKPIRKEFWLILGLTILFMVGIFLVGFYIPALIFIPAAMWILGVRSYRMIIITTVAILVVAYLIFGLWLYIPLLSDIIPS